MSSPLDCLLLQADLERSGNEHTPKALERMTAKAARVALEDLKAESPLEIEFRWSVNHSLTMSAGPSRVMLGGFLYQIAKDRRRKENCRRAAATAVACLVLLDEQQEDPGPEKSARVIGMGYYREEKASGRLRKARVTPKPREALGEIIGFGDFNAALTKLFRDVLGGEIDPDDRAVISKMRRALENTLDEDPPVTPQAEPATDSLSPSRLRAYSLYLEAIKVKPELEARNDSEAYDYIKEHIVDSEDDLPPSFETFRRYLSEARKHFGTRKHTPRAGRMTGGSIVRDTEI